jgi:hypothetical protein
MEKRMGKVIQAKKKHLETRARAALRRLGLEVRKSNDPIGPKNQGRYMVVDPDLYDAPVVGYMAYDMTCGDILSWIAAGARAFGLGWDPPKTRRLVHSADGSEIRTASVKMDPGPFYVLTPKGQAYAAQLDREERAEREMRAFRKELEVPAEQPKLTLVHSKE